MAASSGENSTSAAKSAGGLKALAAEVKEAHKEAVQSNEIPQVPPRYMTNANEHLSHHITDSDLLRLQHGGSRTPLQRILDYLIGGFIGIFIPWAAALSKAYKSSPPVREAHASAQAQPAAIGPLASLDFSEVLAVILGFCMLFGLLITAFQLRYAKTESVDDICAEIKSRGKTQYK